MKNKNELSTKIIAKDAIITIQTMDKSMSYDVWQNSLDEDNRRFVPDEVFETLEEASFVIDSLIKSYENDNGPFVYAIIRNEDQKNLGYVQLIKLDEEWEIGYHIAKKFTGNGYATNAVKLFLEYLTENRIVKDILGIALKDNKASIKVLQKCDFSLIYDGVGLYQGKKRKIVRYIKNLW